MGNAVETNADPKTSRLAVRTLRVSAAKVFTGNARPDGTVVVATNPVALPLKVRARRSSNGNLICVSYSRQRPRTLRIGYD